MAGSVYSVPFIADHALIGTSAYVVPANKVAIVRDLDAFFSDITSTRLELIDATHGLTWWYNDFLATIDSQALWRGRQVFEAGTSFLVSSDHAGVDVRVSGYLLDAG